MKQTLLGFIAAILLIALTAATTVSVMTVKPARPISTMAYSGQIYQVKDVIIEFAKKGYVVKSLSVSSSSASSTTPTLVVMEKY